MIISTAAVL